MPHFFGWLDSGRHPGRLQSCLGPFPPTSFYNPPLFIPQPVPHLSAGPHAARGWIRSRCSAERHGEDVVVVAQVRLEILLTFTVFVFVSQADCSPRAFEGPGWVSDLGIFQPRGAPTETYSLRPPFPKSTSNLIHPAKRVTLISLSGDN